MPDLEEVKAQIQKQSGISKFLGRREIKELPSILWEDEVIENMIQGTYNNGTGILVATNKRLIFIDKGLIKLSVEDFPYDKISTLQYKTGILLGNMTVFTSGNRAEIKNLAKNETKPFAEYVRARITQKSDHASVAKQSNPDSTEDKYVKLERIASLRKQGIISEEEFNIEKTKILS